MTCPDPRIIPKDERGRWGERHPTFGERMLLRHAEAMDERDAARVALIRELVIAISRHTWDVGPAREAKEILLDRIADAKAALAGVPEELRP